MLKKYHTLIGALALMTQASLAQSTTIGASDSGIRPRTGSVIRMVAPIPPVQPMRPLLDEQTLQRKILTKLHMKQWRKSEPLSERDEEALMAVEALMATDNGKATPILKKVLAGQYADIVKSRALFVLIQTDPEAAESTLEPLLSSKASPELQQAAIRALAVGGKKSSMDRLAKLLETTDDEDTQEAIVNAFLISGRKDLMATVAKNAKDETLRRRAIRSMGAQGDKAGLSLLYDSVKDPKTKETVVEALGLAGDIESLEKIAKSDSDLDIRCTAIRNMGMRGGAATTAKLVAIFKSATAEEVENAALQGLQLTGAGDALVQLYNQEKSMDRKRKLMRMIAHTSPDKAIELIDSRIH